MYRTLVVALWGLALGLSFSCLADTEERLAVGFCGQWHKDPRALVEQLRSGSTDPWADWADAVPTGDEMAVARACRNALDRFFEEASFLIPALESFEDKVEEPDSMPQADEFGHLQIEVEDYGPVDVAKKISASGETAATQQAQARELKYHKAWENFLSRLIVRLGRGDL